MRKGAICLSKERGVYNVFLTFSLSSVFLTVLMFQSMAFCASWEPIGPAGGNFIFSVTNPADANEVTAVTTSPSPSNVYRSTDGGANWRKIGEFPYSYVSDVSAFDFSTLYAVSSSFCYRSTDGGANWTSTSLPSSAGWAYRVCVDPTDSSKVYATGYNYDYYNALPYSMVFFKSIDAGQSWSASSFFSFEYFYPEDMVVSRSNPNIIYVVGYKQVGSYSYGALLKSTDNGDSWTDISSSVENEPYNYFDSVAIDPADADKVYVGGSFFYRAVRTGRNRVQSWIRSTNRLYAYSIGIDPVEPSKIYIVGYDAIGVSTDYGQTWAMHRGCVKSSGRHVEVASADTAKVYISTYSGFYKSADSGTSWNSAHEGIHAASIPVLAAGPSTVIIQNSGYLMTYRNSSENIWQDVVTPESCGTVCDILIGDADPDLVLILEDYG